MDAGEAVAKASAAPGTLRLTANEVGEFSAGIALWPFEKKGSHVLADDQVEPSLFGLATLVADSRRGRAAASQRMTE